MDEQPENLQLTPDEQRDVCLVLSLGCDRETAANYIGKTPGAIRNQALADSQFARDLLRATAGIEMLHMGNVKNAARDEKNWRASVWWLERRSPDRYAKREARTMTPAQLKDFIAGCADAVMQEVHNTTDRSRLLERLSAIASQLDSAASDQSNEPSGK